jgi:hypothetical protein
MLREVYLLPKVDNTLGLLDGATIFSKLDANSGFWQILLTKSSQHLTTFITPFGRFQFNKLPFGISSAPEHFQCWMNEIFTDQEGVLCHMDDILIFGQTQEEHDARLRRALQTLESAGVTLNPDKCEFSKTHITFLGHVIDKEGISADPKKTAAIKEMAPPHTPSELRRFMGMVNQLSKFTSDIVHLSQPLQELLSTRKSWLWGPAQEEAFAQIKHALVKPTVLASYNLELPTEIRSDASTYGLGAVLLQQHAQKSGSQWFTPREQ